MVLNFTKGKYSLQLFGFLLFAFVCLLIFQFIGLGVILAYFDCSVQDLANLNANLIKSEKGYWPIIILFLTQSIGLFILPSILFALAMKKSGIEIISFKKYSKLPYLISLPIFAFSALFIVGFFGDLNMKLDLPQYFVDQEKAATETVNYILSFQDPQYIVLNIFFLAILPAIGEELFFRGVVQKLLVSWIGKNWIGILITAFVFSAIHFQFLTFLPRFFMGIMLGYLLVWSRNIWVPIFAHFLHNVLSIVIGLATSTDDFGDLNSDNFLIVTIAIIVFSGMSYWYYSLSKKEYVS